MNRCRFLMILAIALGLALPAAVVTTAVADTDRKDLLYSCACGKECDCGSVNAEPGNCKCGKEMRETHVLKVEGDEAIVCTCGGGCKCELDAKDSTKCGCGKAVERVNLKGSGLYFCNCGGSCKCNTVSGKPGECKCGMKLKQVN